ncbi:Methionine--tRNA ligase, chloroplastic/mitochondrial [Porphyridium purpureum]|uniref:methionine--tRNA ligase n=1 Tax=Porphyridium purpureum TaxID=35688 RepID=A0A5J4Z7N9_PORPP|nr:Methionine--tRNA ligase, chloroplastic/mitochondrial [Porphyridium purpureum]|eukprot:POR6048..scf295_1
MAFVVGGRMVWKPHVGGRGSAWLGTRDMHLAAARHTYRPRLVGLARARSRSVVLVRMSTGPSQAVVPVPNGGASHSHAPSSSRAGRHGVANVPEPGTKFAITTPLYYVNAAPHMGSAYPTIAVDVLTRFYRMTDRDPVFVTGCDEHGEKIAQAAHKMGREPQEHVEIIAAQFLSLWDKLDIKYDRFARTTSSDHAKIVSEFMERVWDNGDIYKSVYEGLYCTGCEEYKDPKELNTGNVCPLHQAECEMRKEENYFFALSKYGDALLEFLEQNPNFIVPEERRNEVLGWIKSGLRDFSVSRANNPWGIRVPRDEKQTIYVWFDALLGYVSSLREEGDEVSLDACVKRGWPANLHVIGKDILRFHAVYWPAMLMSAGLPLPAQVFGHGFLTKDGLKMGKSLGNTLDPTELVDTYGATAVRYFFMRAVEFGQDGDFSNSRFIDVVNSELANSIGNLLNRSLNLLRKNCDSVIPADSQAAADAVEGGDTLRQAAQLRAAEARASFDQRNFPEACFKIVSIAHDTNGFIDAAAPWKKFKEGEEGKTEAGQTLAVVLEATRIVATALNPVVPSLTKDIYAALGFDESVYANLTWKDTEWGMLKQGHAFPTPKPVFMRLEAPQTAV